jgi:hypothetical protein
MAHPRFAMWLLDRLDPCGTREALIGDLVEEMARGRSRVWVWRQVAAVGALAAAGCVRNRAPQTARLVTFALGLFMFGGAMIVPAARLLETWTIVYFAIGTCSLIGDMVSPRSIDSRSNAFRLNPVLGESGPTT